MNVSHDLAAEQQYYRHLGASHRTVRVCHLPEPPPAPPLPPAPPARPHRFPAEDPRASAWAQPAWSEGAFIPGARRVPTDGGDDPQLQAELEDIDHTCKELAHATAQFLLETNSLNWFQRPGGVLLMVMSIAASRGIPKTQGDMDDMTAKLTSTFGHCSQELTNLLLTGQAGM